MCVISLCTRGALDGSSRGRSTAALDAMPTIAPTPFSGCAGVFANDRFVCVLSYSGRMAAAMDPNGAEHLLAPDADNESLGSSLLDALQKSRVLNIEEVRIFFDPQRIAKDYAAWVERLMSRYRFKSKRALFNGMKHCNVHVRAGNISIKPTYHEKSEGWAGMGAEFELVLPSQAPAIEVGGALREGLRRCV